MPLRLRPPHLIRRELEDLQARVRGLERELEGAAGAGEEAAAAVPAELSSGEAEARLRESEERYLALFNSLDQGFCTLDLRFDESGRALDYRFLEVSPSFEAQTGIANAAGRWMREIAADQDEHWFELYGAVARTGEPARFETFSSPLKRWWSVFAFRIGDPAQHRVGVFFQDITKRKKIEIEHLRQALIVENSRDFIGTSDVQGRPGFLNPAGRRLVGLGADEDVAAPHTRDFFVPEERSFVDEVVIPAVLRDGRWSGELTFQHGQTGARIPVWYDLFRVDDPVTGQPVSFATITRDMSERKRVEEELRAARTRLDSTLNAAEVGTFYWDIDQDSMIGDVNFLRIFGVDAAGEGAPLAAYVDRIHEADRPRVSASVALAVVEGGPYSEEYRVVHADGKIRWVHARGIARISEDGKLREFPGVLVDITSRREAEERLVAAERHRRLALEAAEMGAWNIDPVTLVMTSDTRFRLIFSGSPAPMSYEQALALLHPEDRERVQASVQAAMNPENPAPYAEDYRVVHPDGSIHWVQARGGANFDGEGAARRITSFDGTVTDITAQKEAEAALRESHRQTAAAKEESERANKAKDEFIAGLSHELRTPLTPVLLTVQALREDGGLPPAVMEDLRMIQHNVSLEVQLIDDLLDLTRIARGKLRITRRLLDAGGVLRRAIETASAEDLKAKDITLKLDFQAASAHLLADEGRLSQIFWNIIKNAIKFTRHGGTVTVRTRNPAPETFEVSVIDDGIGISPEKIGRIFDAFEQGGTEITRRFGGLGLGLAISRALVEIHGGSITAHSLGEGQGAEFVMTFPVVPGGAAAGGQPVPAHVAGPSGPGLRILLVEDHPDSGRMLQRLLARAGHDVRLATTVAEALAAAGDGTGKPDLVVSDLGLPDGSGHDLMRELRDRYALRGIALSGYGMEEDRRLSHAAGFTHHLVKPVDIRLLHEAIRDITGEEISEDEV